MADILHNFTKKKLELQGSEKYQDLVVNGQKPKYLIICCSDSRVDPTTLFNTSMGEIFVVRTVASIVPEYSDQKSAVIAAAVEFAVTNLQIKTIIIIGHSCCGGAKAMLDIDNIDDDIKKWVITAAPAQQIPVTTATNYTYSKEDITAMQILTNSYNNIHHYPAVKKNKITIKAWFYDLQRVEIMQKNNNNFELIS